MRGESLAFVGIAGVGKSNLVNFLREFRGRLDGNGVVDLFFPVVDATYWEGTPGSLWRLMLNALAQATNELPPPTKGNGSAQASETERAFNTLQVRLEWICQKRGHRVMFVLDDFDAVLERGPLPMLERLNGLRSEGNRGYLSYLVFTKRLPHILGRPHNLESQSKFYDLFRYNIYALEPYLPEDARQMLAHLNERAGKPLSEADLAQIHELAGGHARLLKIVFETWVHSGAPKGDALSYFANHPDVVHECRRIVSKLHEHEQHVAFLIAQGRSAMEHKAVVEHLTRRGVLVKLSPPVWFSPLFGAYLSSRDHMP
ncbi:hypothetical protein D6833_00535 [Candidatus Parcubacteria bacterium]|nr:MAG: hypothetical protein D6833_00535 [Candidatus Parcubacteria bacterium]